MSATAVCGPCLDTDSNKPTVKKKKKKKKEILWGSWRNLTHRLDIL